MRTFSCPRLPVLGVLLCSGASCSVLYGINVDDYAGGRPDGGLDASDDRAEPPTDAGGDAGGDTRSGSDATGDASNDAPDAPPASPCLGGTHLLCEDFDESATLPQPKWSPFVTGAAALDVNGTDWRSSPRSLAVSNPPTTFASIAHTFTGVDPGGDLRLSFDIRVKQAGDLIIAQLSVDTYNVRLGITPDGVYNVDEWNGAADAGTNPQSNNELGPKTVDAWVNVAMVVHFVKNKQAGSTFTAYLNGTAMHAPIALNPTVDTGAPDIQLGICDQPPTVNQMHFDNIVFDAP
jgi:hypothetical protein